MTRQQRLRQVRPPWQAQRPLLLASRRSSKHQVLQVRAQLDLVLFLIGFGLPHLRCQCAVLVDSDLLVQPSLASRHVVQPLVHYARFPPGVILISLTDRSALCKLAADGDRLFVKGALHVGTSHLHDSQLTHLLCFHGSGLDL